MKVFLLKPNESWIVDRFVDEWNTHNEDISTLDPNEADIIWLMADWCYNKLPYGLLEKKKVVTTVFHIVPEKFDEQAKLHFMKRDKITDLYHASSDKTVQQLLEFGATKPIRSELVWVNGNIWKDLTNEQDIELGNNMLPVNWHRRQRLKKEIGLTEKDFVIGSFQRDSEGSDLSKGKYEKGPDVFCDFVALAKTRLAGSEMTPVVMLGGWRRQYVMKRLDDMDVRYIYNELPSFEKLNEMYNTLDLYVVASRYEGGPQALLECAATNTPVVSTNVGVALQILSADSVAATVSAAALIECKPKIHYAFDKVQPLLIPYGFKRFKKMLMELNMS